VSTVIVTDSAEWEELVSDRSGGPPRESWDESPGFWLCTSGSTGRPKLAMHRHVDLRVTADTYGADVPVPGYRVEVVDDDGRPVPVGTAGHLEVSGDSMAVGYWCDTAASQRSFRGDRMHTGDMYVCSTDGYFTYLGRSDDMLRVGGEWVSPAEVEAVLVTNPAVLEAAVVGYRDEQGVQRPAAYVVAAPGQEVDLAALEVLCGAELAGYKRPKRYDVVSELPKTATGKIRRDALREQLGTSPVALPTNDRA
jgi:acyl-coenzyme A synthetase/AMP-(fatty) acid ligase